MTQAQFIVGTAIVLLPIFGAAVYCVALLSELKSTCAGCTSARWGRWRRRIERLKGARYGSPSWGWTTDTHSGRCAECSGTSP